MIQLFKRWLEKLACKHKWTVHANIKSYSEGYERPTRITETLICSECGKIKKIRL